MSDVDKIIKKYGDELYRIYHLRTAGDHTFTGVLSAMLMEMREKGVQL